MYFVYILHSTHIDRYYIGHTSDIQIRIECHNNGSSRYTARAKDWKLVYQEEYETKGEAMKRENEIKQKKSRVYIEELINSGGRPD